MVSSKGLDWSHEKHYHTDNAPGLGLVDYGRVKNCHLKKLPLSRSPKKDRSPHHEYLVETVHIFSPLRTLCRSLSISRI